MIVLECRQLDTLSCLIEYGRKYNEDRNEFRWKIGFNEFLNKNGALTKYMDEIEKLVENKNLEYVVNITN